MMTTYGEGLHNKQTGHIFTGRLWQCEELMLWSVNSLLTAQFILELQVVLQTAI